MFGIAPFAAVFYPVAILPHWLQPVALAIPAAHVFEGMRATLTHGVMEWGHLGWAVLLDGVAGGGGVDIPRPVPRSAGARGAAQYRGVSWAGQAGARGIARRRSVTLRPHCSATISSVRTKPALV